MPSAEQILTVPDVPQIFVEDDWQVACTAQGCRAEPFGQGSPELTLGVVIEEGSEVLVLRAPLGLLLGEGVSVVVDGRSVGRLAFLTCELDGCVAPVRLDGALRRALRGGTTLNLSLRRRTGELISVEVSLIGFIAATTLLGRNGPDNSDTN
jgi:invasion protein IalB